MEKNLNSYGRPEELSRVEMNTRIMVSKGMVSKSKYSISEQAAGKK